MSRDRNLPDDRKSDPRFADLSLPAMAIYLLLFNEADNYGDLRVDPPFLQLQILPGHIEERDRLMGYLQEIHDSGLGYLYRVENKLYMALLDWFIDQRLTWRGTSKIPIPINIEELSKTFEHFRKLSNILQSVRKSSPKEKRREEKRSKEKIKEEYKETTLPEEKPPAIEKTVGRVKDESNNPILNLYQKLFKEIKGEDAEVSWGKEATLAVRMAKSKPIEKIEAMLRLYLKDEDPLYKKNGWAFSVFASSSVQSRFNLEVSAAKKTAPPIITTIPWQRQKGTECGVECKSNTDPNHLSCPEWKKRA